MDANRAFALKISIMNSLGFAATMASTTFVDSRVSSGIDGPRTYPFGYWPCSLAIPIFAATYLWLAKRRPLASAVSVPPLVLLIAGMICLPAYIPGFPNGNITFWIFLYSLVSGASCWFRYSLSPPWYLHNPQIPEYLQLERIKESVNLWRTISISVTLGYIALLIPWTNFIWDFAWKTVKVPREAILVGNYPAMELATFSLYFLIAIIYEGFRRSTVTADFMLQIQNESTSSHCEPPMPSNQPKL